ncbi:hypothetical protein [Arthrobacter sp. SAFR-044]|uniref:hypothetical protein n=1 Tax=Arthrobacter sp. SAFR-044 TaxID=3387278 RepID=UPI003F7C7053
MSGTNLSGTAQLLPRYAWPVFLVGAILLLAVGNPTVYGIGVPLAALVLALVVPMSRPRWTGHPDWRDVGAVAALYVGVVALFWLAFRVFTQGNTL